MPVTADRQVEWAGLLLDPPYRVQQIDGLFGLPDMRTGDIERVAGDGEVAGIDRLGGRTVTLTLTFSDDDELVFAAAMSALRATLASRAEQAFVFRLPGIADGRTVRILARARRSASPVNTLYHQLIPEIVVEFRATDPRIYDNDLTTSTLTPATPSGGFSFPLSFPLDFGTLGSAGVATITNAGNVPAPVTIRINGPVTGPRVRNEDTGQELAVDIDLAAGEWVDLDSAAKTVLLNGTANRYHLLTTAQWWELQPGANQIRLSADVATGSSATVQFRSSWL